MIDNIKEIQVLGSKLSLLSEEELLTEIKNQIITGNKHIRILSGNIHSNNLAHNLDWYCQCLNAAEFVRLDGEGIRWGAKVLGYSTPKRTTWADFAWSLGKFGENEGFTFYFLGGSPGIAELAKRELERKYPKILIIGTHHGYFNKDKKSEENKMVIDQINLLQPNILIVGLGMPIQEKWLLENYLDLNVNVIFTGGAVFDYISGNTKRAPRWMTDHGLEWLGRLIIEPRRLWKRYIIGIPIFFWRVFLQRLGLLKVQD